MRNRYVFMVLMSLVLLSGVLTFSGCGNDKNSVPTPNFGVVTLNDGWIGILDGTTQTLTTPLLTGELTPLLTYEWGTSNSYIFDVAISPDGKTTLVSNFEAKKVFFIDTSEPTEPVVIGNVEISFFAEDIAITPNGRYALVTNGGFSPKIAVLDMEHIRLVAEQEFEDPSQEVEEGSDPPLLHHAAVAVAADGETVLTVDYSGGSLHAFTLDGDGHLTYVATIDVSNGDTLRPVNLAISPDGKTVVLANTSSDAADMAFTVLNITGPGQVAITELVTAGISIVGAQSVVFNRAGTKAYLNCVQEYIAPDPAPETPVYPNNVILVLNVTGPGRANDAGTPIEVDFAATSQLFGVETLAIDYTDNYLYVSNMTLSGAKNHVQVLDLTTDSVIETVAFDPVAIGDPAVDTDSIPAGVAIWNP